MTEPFDTVTERITTTEDGPDTVNERLSPGGPGPEGQPDTVRERLSGQPNDGHPVDEPEADEKPAKAKRKS